MTVLLAIRATIVALLLAPVNAGRRMLHPRRPATGTTRILIPFVDGDLDQRVLDAAIRIARAEAATLVPAYLIVVPLRFRLDAPIGREIEVAMPLLEAVEHAALRAGIPVDARIETGRTPSHALERLWTAEAFDRIVVPAPAGATPGFIPKDLLWILTHAPSETLILRPAPDETGTGGPRWQAHWSLGRGNGIPGAVGVAPEPAKAS